MNPPPTLETPRLRLRAPVVDDAAAIFAAYTQDAQVLGPVPRDVWSFARIRETGARP